MAHPTPRTQRYSALTFLWSQAIKRAMHIESGEGASAGSENALHDRPAATVPPIAYPWEYGCKSIRVYLGFVPSHWRRMRYLIQTRTLRSLYAAISPSRMLTLRTADCRHASLATKNFRSISTGLWRSCNFGRSEFSPTDTHVLMEVFTRACRPNSIN
jgi:hypothetical protein